MHKTACPARLPAQALLWRTCLCWEGSTPVREVLEVGVEAHLLAADHVAKQVHTGDGLSVRVCVWVWVCVGGCLQGCESARESGGRGSLKVWGLGLVGGEG
jgi:hypothetical protein